MEGATVLLVVLWVLIPGGVGYLIGSAKGRGGLGFVLGLFLGVIGWIIIAVIRRTPEKEAEYQDRVAANRGSGEQRGSQRWAIDPYRRHEHRLFDGKVWTDRVSDSGAMSSDPPTFPAPDGDGWASDPFGRYEQRFHRAGAWTEHVSSGGTTANDPASFPAPTLPTPTEPPAT